MKGAAGFSVLSSKLISCPLVWVVNNLARKLWKISGKWGKKWESENLHVTILPRWTCCQVSSPLIHHEIQNKYLYRRIWDLCMRGRKKKYEHRDSKSWIPAVLQIHPLILILPTISCIFSNWLVLWANGLSLTPETGYIWKCSPIKSK